MKGSATRLSVGDMNITQTYNGFAVPLQPDTDLHFAMLVAEDEEGSYEPIDKASTIAEGKELASDDMKRRLKRLEADQHSGICPYAYKLWARGVDGVQCVAATWNVAELAS
jgi:hypothetical protein